MDVQALARLIAVARGEEPADLVLKGGRVVNVFTGEVLPADVAVAGGVIAGVGEYSRARTVVELEGRFVLPGLIDAHVHIESSLLHPASYAAAVVPRGTTAVIADPHEIANVLGMAGLEFMLRATEDLPLDVFFMVPSCVPATALETTGGTLGDRDIAAALALSPRCLGLGEFMDFPGVLRRDPRVLARLMPAWEENRPIDGHAPGVTGRDLQAYLATRAATDHEGTTVAEALEKMRAGVHVILREGSAARNLADLLPLVDDNTYPLVSFGSDDRHAPDLLREGGLDYFLREAVAAGLPPARAVCLASLNTARHYGLRDRGAVAPGYRADLVVVRDLEDFEVELVYKNGNLVAAGGRLLRSPGLHRDPRTRNTVRLPGLSGRFALRVPHPEAVARVIEVVPGQILSRQTFVPAGDIGPDRDVLPLAVAERHGKTGHVALGLVRGFGLRRGALASTVAHDHHNLILVGTAEGEMEHAAAVVEGMGGGLAVVAGGEVLASLPLPVAGLMAEGQPHEVAEGYERVEAAARALGCTLPSPFMTLSFLGLAVIPELRLTDRGLVDVLRGTLVDLWLGPQGSPGA